MLWSRRNLNATNGIRGIARRFLPGSVRKPLGGLWGQFRGRMLYPTLGLIFDLKGGRFRADGCDFVIPKDITTFESRAAFLTGAYEADERKLVKKFLSPEDSILELGACLGIVSCIANKILRDPAKHVVVEANPFCLPSLHRNRDLNKCAFLTENCAASNDASVMFFLHPRYFVCGTTKVESAFPVRVPGRSLEDLARRYGPFSALIMDIEGAELEILESSREILGAFRLVIIELHDWVIGSDGVSRCRAILEESGFRMVERSFVTEAWVQS